MKQIKNAIIPVAGMGTRFLPATKAQPKEMLPLVDKPVIQYVVEEAAEANINNVIFITGRNKQSIENHFDIAFELEHTLEQRGCAKELEIVRRINRLMHFTYVRQGEALGLGHAISCAANIAGNDPIAVLLGDDVFSQETPAIQHLIHAHQKTGHSVVGVQEVAYQEVSRYGIVSAPTHSADHWPVINIIEKPSSDIAPSRYAVVGRYILTHDIFNILFKTTPGHGGEYQLTDALSVLAHQGRLIAVPIPNQRFDTGSKLEYLKASIEFGLLRSEFNDELKQYIHECAERLKASLLEI